MDPLYRLFRPLLFALDAERAHNGMIKLLAAAPAFWAALARRTYALPPAREGRLGPLSIPYPLGLAAGLDKNGVAIPFWPALGFGFVEVGTVTARQQPGNPKPRLFRLPAERGLINRLGFNNEGSAALAARLRRLREAGAWPAVPVGVNVGKSRATPVAEATADYALSVERLAGLADYFTINVSSPNTEGLRSLQERDALAELVPAVVARARGAPVFVKLAPDLEPGPLAEAVEVAIEGGAAGLIATNTTVRREGLLARDPELAGGLSGRPLWPLARRKVLEVLAAARGRVPVVGVGGIAEAAEARELLEAGCAAVQLYSALVFEGPGLPSRLLRELAHGGEI